VALLIWPLKQEEIRNRVAELSRERRKFDSIENLYINGWNAQHFCDYEEGRRDARACRDDDVWPLMSQRLDGKSEVSEGVSSVPRRRIKGRHNSLAWQHCACVVAIFDHPYAVMIRPP
jgi:hypothetical protein